MHKTSNVNLLNGWVYDCLFLNSPESSHVNNLKQNIRIDVLGCTRSGRIMHVTKKKETEIVKEVYCSAEEE